MKTRHTVNTWYLVRVLRHNLCDYDEILTNIREHKNSPRIPCTAGSSRVSGQFRRPLANHPSHQTSDVHQRLVSSSAAPPHSKSGSQPWPPWQRRGCRRCRCSRVHLGWEGAAQHQRAAATPDPVCGSACQHVANSEIINLAIFVLVTCGPSSKNRRLLVSVYNMQGCAA